MNFRVLQILGYETYIEKKWFETGGCYKSLISTVAPASETVAELHMRSQMLET
jgi:hypothetical protein